MKKVLLAVLAMLLLPAGFAFAADKSPLELSGDYRFRYDVLDGTVTDHFSMLGGASVTGYDVKNNSLMMNRFGLNVKAEALEDVRVKARLVMYKVAGHQTADPFLDSFFGDRFAGFGVHDGISGHVPQDNTVRVDYAYATVSNVFDQPIWVSVGRRPSTGGAPGNLRQNVEKAGSAGIPAIMVDFAFDGGTIGWAPNIESLPGAYMKLCAGRGYEAGFTGSSHDTNFVGLNLVPYDDDKLHIELQYQVGKHIFDLPSDGGTFPAPIGQQDVTSDLGNIEWLGGLVTKKLGNLNMFVSAAMSKTDPTSGTLLNNPGMPGMLWDGSTGVQDHSGNAIYVGGRYDMGSTKIGLEYNKGSQYWIGMVPAGDDVWTSKLGARGSVYEVYLIQELTRKAVSKGGKAYVRLGYQYYDFDYTGSNMWVGVPHKIDTMTLATAELATPIKEATDFYLTFDVEF